MNARREEKAISWGKYYGEIGAWQHIRELPEATAEEVAQQQARNYEKIFDLTIPEEEYPEWERVFVDAYTTIYVQTLEGARQ